ncbi:MAG: NDP-hexose 2,3-dehydratase family protein [Nitrospirae bacterium]|nr:NDP-hexose 2,3-dehydratase family protein [Nitrospirota bacterium]
MDDKAVLDEIRNIREILCKSGLSETSSAINPAFAFGSETIFDMFVSRVIDQSLNSDDVVNHWIDTRVADKKLEATIVPVADIEQWRIEDEWNISHESGRFFTVTGLKVRHRVRHEEIEWDQPIIDQPEVGILGILAARFSGVLHFCLQAKEEPGNINSIQLAPTVQATYSNYTRVHGGRRPDFIDLFLDPPSGNILFSRLQAEDGGRFLFKSNKNMIVLADADDYRELPSNFIWLTLRQIGMLMERDNLLNYCTRSVLSCLV